MIKKFNESWDIHRVDCDECSDLGVVECPNCMNDHTVECDICTRKEVPCPECEDTPWEDSLYAKAREAENDRLRKKVADEKAKKDLEEKQSRVWLGQHVGENKVYKFGEYKVNK